MLYGGTLNERLSVEDLGRKAMGRAKKSGLKAVTLIAAPNPVSQVLW
jgi:hypothetical protein